MPFPPNLPRARAFWLVAALLVLWWTLLPFTYDLSPRFLGRSVARIQWIPFVENGRFPLWSDLIENLALFIPIGLTGWWGIERRGGRVAVVLLSAAALSFSIEAVQLTIPARRTSATDLVTDVLGALAGIGVARGWELWGSEPARDWVSALRRGDPDKLFVALFASSLVVWALLPGPHPPGGVWRQVQGFSSSFRRLPGWEVWADHGTHPFLLGWVFSALASGSAHGSARHKAATGAFAALALGFVLEGLHLLISSRRPEVLQALAFGLGGISGSLLRASPRWAKLGTASLAVSFGLATTPGGDSPAGETWAVLLFGALLVSAQCVFPELARPRRETGA